MTQTTRLKDQIVNATELQEQAPNVNRYHFAKTKGVKQPLASGDQKSKHPVLKGSILTERSASDVVIHMTNAIAMQDFMVETKIEPCVRIILFFEGENRFQYGPHSVTFHKDSQRAKVVTVREVAPCHMSIRNGDRRCGLYVSVSPAWFAEQGLNSAALEQRLAEHLSVSDWSLPRHLWLHARKLLDAPASSATAKLAREAFAMSLIAAWLDSLEEQSSEQAGHDSRQGLRFCQLLAQEESWSMSLEEIGHQLGMSAATLQRYAHDHLGMSLTQYLRKQRLAQACQVLYREHASISEAALLAGYNHPNNFSAAFKRHFGVSPNEVHQYSLNALLTRH
ncbi:helix-turn-helix transcriptional regulator [Marinomonas ostreistagni]|uniref:Helix-turn-helix transcriptional regulator n=1 Tax=Marinomonas ostreistagni TaxID=359209 RepID=A0ABS0ZFJ3_9GAMM|nr:helix-turn-helix transcriptional regulator [Marinomonas ostreistagni]MBJ7552183.1 helix-turn-helix transcriptional regulator [Marinomonas ostreistagni]